MRNFAVPYGTSSSGRPSAVRTRTFNGADAVSFHRNGRVVPSATGPLCAPDQTVGGGAGAPGGESSWDGGIGGDGLAFSITGEEVWYAGGGAGYRASDHVAATRGGKGGGGNGTAGVDGLGGGGSGGCNGGSGVVIIRYRSITGMMIIAR